MDTGLGYAIAGALAGALAAAELVSRYRDRPIDLLRTAGTWFYTGLNAGAGCAALLLIRAFGWDFGAEEGTGTVRVLAAGFGSLAVFRSSLFVVRVGGDDVAIGPSTFLSLALNAADRGVDRHQATERSRRVSTIMQGVSFEKAQEALPTYCLGLMESVPVEDQRRLAREVAALDKGAMPDAVKAMNLGLSIIRVTGSEVLGAAVQALGASIAIEREP